ncbi:MAG: hypothetical protein KA015_00400 [Spirochaetes bacterium]|nr:hypothetical protein [Spirochaetota bacterium]
MKLKNLSDKKIIVSAGGTVEMLDPVRFMTNRSSGKMGIAIADAASKAGLDTVLIAGNVDKNLISGKKYRIEKVLSTRDMLEAVTKELSDDTLLIMAAAPADYSFKEKSPVKIKKKSEELNITLVKNPDILMESAEIRKSKGFNNLILAGFAAETNDLEKYALGKLKEKNLDLICANDVSSSENGFESDYNKITIYFKNGLKKELSRALKKDIAKFILKNIDIYLGETDEK